MNGEQTMLTLSALGVHERWTNYAHFVSVGGKSTVNKLCSLCQHWGVHERWTNYAHFVRIGGQSTVDKLCSLCQLWGSMNGGQTILTLSALGVYERWTNYAHFVTVGGP